MAILSLEICARYPLPGHDGKIKRMFLGKIIPSSKEHFMHRGRQYVGSISIVLFCLMGIYCSKSTPTAPASPTELEGTWKETALGANYTLICSNNAFYMSGDLVASGAFSINTGTNPKQIDIVIASDSDDSSYVGKTSLGVYALNGNSLRMALGEPGTPRVTFTSSTAEVFTFVKQ
jgi:uncharacterized protein (TIGR03067 family)